MNPGNIIQVLSMGLLSLILWQLQRIAQRLDDHIDKTNVSQNIQDIKIAKCEEGFEALKEFCVMRHN